MRGVRDLQREAQDRVDQIVAFVDFCFDVLTVEMRLCMKAVSNRTGLCLATLYKLKRGELTDHTRIGTIQKVAKAAKAELALTRPGVTGDRIVVGKRKRRGAAAAA